MLVGLLALATLTGTVTGPTAPQRYRIEVKVQQDIDATAAGQGKMTIDIAVVGFVTVTMSDTTGGQVAHIVVDSVTVPAGVELPPQVGDPALAKGVYYHSYIIDGKAKGGLKPSQPVPVVTLLAGGIENLFPGLRTTAKVGDSWVDTVTTDRSVEGNTQKTTTWMNWKASAGVAGALTYDATTTGTVQAESQSPNGKQTIAGKISGTRSLSGPAIGPMQKGTIKAIQDLTVAMEGSSDALSVVITNEISFTIIP